MPVDAPPTGLEAEVRQHDPRGLKGAVAVAQRRPHACIAEPDDVGAAVTGDVGEEAGIALDDQRADSGPTATDGMQHPPRAPGTPNWSGAGCSHVSCTQDSPPSSETHRPLESDPAKTSLPSSELASDSIRPVTSCQFGPKDMLDLFGLTSVMVTMRGLPQLWG